MCVTRGRLGQLDLADAAHSGNHPRRACFHHDPRRFAWYVSEVATIIDDRDARSERAIRSRCWSGGLYSGGQSSVRRKGKGGMLSLRFRAGPARPKVQSKRKSEENQVFSGLDSPQEEGSITCYSTALGGVGPMDYPQTIRLRFAIRTITETVADWYHVRRRGRSRTIRMYTETDFFVFSRCEDRNEITATMRTTPTISA